jgi:hypothetical protein
VWWPLLAVLRTRAAITAVRRRGVVRLVFDWVAMAANHIRIVESFQI